MTRLPIITDTELVAVGAGALALTHRPRLAALAAIRAAGATHLVTLLADREGARQLGAAATTAGLAWIWIPFENGNVPALARDAELRAALARVAAIVDGGGKVVVHCSAGIHRTGMFGYALLRHLGLTADAARAKLRELRDITADGVGVARMAWGDRLSD